MTMPATGAISAADINAEFGFAAGTPVSWGSQFSRALAKKASGEVSLLQMRGRKVRQNLTVTNATNSSTMNGSSPDRWQITGKFGTSGALSGWTSMWGVTAPELNGYLYEAASAQSSFMWLYLGDTATSFVAEQATSMVINGSYFGPDTTPALTVIVDNTKDNCIGSTCQVSFTPAQRALYPVPATNSYSFKTYVIGDN